MDQITITDDRAAACWRVQDCYSCTHSSHGCKSVTVQNDTAEANLCAGGWCPFSGICVPTTNLLKPVTDSHICPLRGERFELRTKALGCGCSTTTLLSIIVTVFATLVAAALLSGIVAGVLRFNRTFGTGTWSGTEIDIKEDGTRDEHQWRRSNAVTSFFRRTTLKATKESEQEQVTERSRLLG